MKSVPLAARIDTPIEVAYFSAGGIMPYVLNELVGSSGKSSAKTPSL
jgi:hypothetical protein